MPFKHGRLAEVLLNSQDISPFLNSADWASKVDTAPVATFKSTWKSFIPGQAGSTLASAGYYDSTLTSVRATLQATAGVLSYAPAGATTIGDLVRQMAINSTDYVELAKIVEAVIFNWSVQSTAPVGIGVSLHPLASENVGTITGTGDG